MSFRIVVGVNAGVALGLALSLLYRDGLWESFLIPAAVMIPLGAAGEWAILLRGLGYVLGRDV